MSKRTHTFNWVLDPRKFLSKEEAKRLLETAKKRAQLAVAQGRKTPVRDYFIVDLTMSTGLRVMEVARLTCGDIYIQDGRFSLLVRRGKGGKISSTTTPNTLEEGGSGRVYTHFA